MSNSGNAVTNASQEDNYVFTDALGSIIHYIGNPDNYKRVRQKQATMYVCAPALGSVVRDPFEGREYIITQFDRYCCCNPGGSYDVSSAKNLMNYQRKGGKFVNSAFLRHIESKPNEWFPLDVVLPIDDLNAIFIPKRYRNIRLDSVNTIMQMSDLSLLFTASSSKILNVDGVNHGKGDFLVCDTVNGKPDVRRLILVNGLVFAELFDLHGWHDCTVSVKTKPSLAYIQAPSKGIPPGFGYTILQHIKSYMDEQATVLRDSGIGMPDDPYVNVTTSPSGDMVKGVVSLRVIESHGLVRDALQLGFEIRKTELVLKGFYVASEDGKCEEIKTVRQPLTRLDNEACRCIVTLVQKALREMLTKGCFTGKAG